MRELVPFKCIYCPSEESPSDEHYLCKGLGIFKNFEQLCGKICRKCNREIGDSIELPFLRTGLVGLLRWRLGITDIEGTPSPCYHGAGGEPPVVIRATPPESDHEILWEAEPGTDNLIPLRQIILLSKDGRVFHFPVKDWIKQQDELITLIREKTREGYVDMATHHDDNEEEAVQALHKQIGGELVFRRLDWQTQRKTVTVQYLKTPKFKRVFAKIAFHFALKAYPMLKGSEPEFDLIRAAIKNGVGDLDFVREDLRPIYPPLLSGTKRDHWMHILTVEWHKENIKGYVRLFDHQSSQPLAYNVIIGQPPSIIIPARHSLAQRFHYYPVAQGKHQGYMDKFEPTLLDLNPYRPS